jgi:hypothetical protein
MKFALKSYEQNVNMKPDEDMFSGRFQGRLTTPQGRPQKLASGGLGDLIATVLFGLVKRLIGSLHHLIPGLGRATSRRSDTDGHPY